MTVITRLIKYLTGELKNMGKKEPKIKVITYKKFIRQSEKAWLVELEGGTEVFFSKKYCKLYLGKNSIMVPTWLYEKMGVE